MGHVVAKAVQRTNITVRWDGGRHALASLSLNTGPGLDQISKLFIMRYNSFIVHK